MTDYAQLALVLFVASERVPAGKAGYLETGLSGLREHGGKTYSWQHKHRRPTLTPHQPGRTAEEAQDVPTDETDYQSMAQSGSD